MSGLRPLLFATLPCLFLLASCDKDAKEAPPPAGTVTTSDPRAAALYAKAEGFDQRGKQGKAVKLYEKIADKYPYADVSPQSRYRQGELLEADGKLLDAFDAYQDVIHRYPRSGLFSKARFNQEVVAHAAADGLIKNSFLGLKSRLDTKKTVEMLEKVQANAPQSHAAPKAIFRIGQLLESRKKHNEAIAAYERVVDNYASSSLAPEAQYQIGAILLESAQSGNQNQANLDKARHTFEDLVQFYPRSARAADAKRQIGEIGTKDISRSFNIAEFYYKKGETASAAFYYEEVLRKVQSGKLHEKATKRLATINSE